jgi:hypothetical protein
VNVPPISTPMRKVRMPYPMERDRIP